MPLSLAPSDVREHVGCFAGGHVVFIAQGKMGSGVMRGLLVVSVLRQSFARHRVNASFFDVAAHNNATDFEAHLDAMGVMLGGRPAACILVKYGVPWVADVCRGRGATALLDTIDNYRAFDERELRSRELRPGLYDAMLVQTRQHGEWLAARNRTTALLPHPHGNLAGWGVARGVRERIRGVGFVFQDPKNVPDDTTIIHLARSVCRANATLFAIGNRVTGGGRAIGLNLIPAPEFWPSGLPRRTRTHRTLL